MKSKIRLPEKIERAQVAAWFAYAGQRPAVGDTVYRYDGGAVTLDQAAGIRVGVVDLDEGGERVSVLVDLDVELHVDWSTLATVITGAHKAPPPGTPAPSSK